MVEVIEYVDFGGLEIRIVEYDFREGKERALQYRTYTITDEKPEWRHEAPPDEAMAMVQQIQEMIIDNTGIDDVGFPDYEDYLEAKYDN